MFTVCSAQLVSTQPANKDKRNLTLFVHSSAVLIMLLATDTKAAGTRRSSWSLAELKLDEPNREN